MKANEAPERIYLFENPIDDTPDYMWLSKRSCDNDIEYTRTDAFIEKACGWIKENGLCLKKLVIQKDLKHRKEKKYE